MAVELPYTLTNGDLVDANEVQANDEALAAGMSRISNADVVADAGIEVRKLNRYFVLVPIVIPVLPPSAGADLATPTPFQPLPASMTEVVRQRILLQPNVQRAFVARVDVSTQATTGTDEVRLQVAVDSTVLGGTHVVLSAATPTIQTLANSTDPVANPILPVQDGQVIIVSMSESAGSATARGVTVTVWLKCEMVS